METLWNVDSKEYALENIGKVKGDKYYDVVIVGGGLTALLSAYFLKDSNLKIAVICDKEFTQSASVRSNAKITTVNTTLYSKIAKDYGVEKAKFFYLDKFDAMMSYVKIIKDHNIDCDFEKSSSYVYSITDEGKAKLIEEMTFFNYNDIPFVHHLEKLENLIDIKNAYEFQNQYSFNPMKFMMSLVSLMNKYENMDFYDNSLVTKIHNKYLIANGYKINFKKSIIATHYPPFKFLGQYPLKLYQEKATVGCFRTTTPIKNMYVSIDENALSLRPLSQETVILVANNHRLGEESKRKLDLREYANNNFEKVEDFKIYGNQDCVSFDGLPYVDKACFVIPNVYIATGYNLFGITSSMLSAKHISKNILYNTPLPKLYSRNRFNYKAQKDMMGKHFKIVFSEIINKNKRNTVSKNISQNIDKLEDGNGFTFRHRGKNIGVCKDKGKLIFIKNKCAHLGCPLYFNKDTLTWDCRCHGSSYKPNGEYIYSPTNKNLDLLDITEFKN